MQLLGQMNEKWDQVIESDDKFNKSYLEVLQEMNRRDQERHEMEMKLKEEQIKNLQMRNKKE